MKAQASLPPKLTVNPQVITETDSVTLNCQAPTSVSHCYFHTLSEQTATVLPCLYTLTGTELLQMAHQRSPAEVEVKCYYTAMFGDTYSSHSDSSSITIQSQKPQMTLQHFDGEYVLFTCSLPGSANHDTRCNLYFGEASHPVKTTTLWRETTSTNWKFCQFTVSIDDLLTHLRSVLRKDASCDYTFGSEPNSLSPRSGGYSLTDIVDKESSKMQTTPTLTMTTGLPSYRRVSTPVKPTSGTFTGITMTSPDAALTNQASNDEITETWIWKLVVVVVGFGVTVGVILLGFAPLYNQSTIEKCAFKRPKAIITDYRDYMNLQAGYDETYSIVIYKCNIDYRDYMLIFHLN
ncbi:uncharacterized protein [Thunnus thynnus]|uniref:uncharacterized protein n=1 Tax=Thunnus thynnus TaxID=8237 RepID=UPI00352732A6